MNLFEKVKPVTASLFTWEQTTAFDGALSDKEIRRRFREEFPDFDGFGQVSFWPLIAFNTSDGRKHRFLVAYPCEKLECYRTSFERCLPRQVVLYNVADALLRGKWSCSECLEMCDCYDSNEGNLLMATIFEGKMYLLVFVAGRLCHWSEECGYEAETPEMLKRLCLERISRFRNFMARDGFFSNFASNAPLNMVSCIGSNAELDAKGNGFATFRTILLPQLDFGEKNFREAAKDVFWRHLDLDETESTKICVQRKWLLFLSVALLLTIAALLYHPIAESLFSTCLSTADSNHENVLAAASDSVAENVIGKKEMTNLVDAYFLQGSKRLRMQRKTLPSQKLFGKKILSKQERCAVPDLVVNGIVSGRAVLAEIGDDRKVLRMGDSVNHYRIRDIGRKDVLLECGRRTLRLESSKQ